MDFHLLRLNGTKTKFITYTNSPKTQPNRINIKFLEGCNLINCECESTTKNTTGIKYLGVIIIYETLKWNKHSEFLNNNLGNLVFAFYKLREILAEKI